MKQMLASSDDQASSVIEMILADVAVVGDEVVARAWGWGIRALLMDILDIVANMLVLMLIIMIMPMIMIMLLLMLMLMLLLMLMLWLRFILVYSPPTFPPS